MRAVARRSLVQQTRSAALEGDLAPGSRRSRRVLVGDGRHARRAAAEAHLLRAASLRHLALCVGWSHGDWAHRRPPLPADPAAGAAGPTVLFIFSQSLSKSLSLADNSVGDHVRRGLTFSRVRHRRSARAALDLRRSLI